MNRWTDRNHERRDVQREPVDPEVAAVGIMDTSTERDQERRVPSTRQGFEVRDMYGSSTEQCHWLLCRAEKDT